MKSWLIRSRRRRGTVAVITAVCLVPLIGMLAFLLDGGILMAQQRQTQAATDASAQAAAVYLYNNYTTNAGLDPQGKAAALAKAYASSNGFTNNTTNSTVTVNIPPLSGLFTGEAGYAEIIVKYNQPRLFSAMFGSSTIPVTARTVARGTYAPYSDDAVIALNPTGAGAVTAAGSAKLIASATVQVDSSNVGAVNVNNTGNIKAPTISITGNWAHDASGTLTGSVVTGAASASDPLATLPAPPTTGLTTQPSLPGYGSYTMNPGIYNGGVTFGGGMNITMNPGIYYIQNGGFTVANGVTLTGTGVTIYITPGSGAFSFQGGGVINLSAPTSGTYSGIVMYQDRSNTTPISIANGTTTTITGTFYAAGAVISFAGGAQMSQFGSQIIASGVNLSNNAYVNVNWNAGTVARRPSLNIVE
jgi:Flp pilus assembly protein TadG